MTETAIYWAVGVAFVVATILGLSACILSSMISREQGE